jgi:hypothetical protein
MTLDLAERVKIGFPKAIEFPEILTQLCIWHERENSSKTVSGYFEFFEGDRSVIDAWVSQESAQNRFGMFGMSVDGGLYCVWVQDDGKQPVIYLGSGQSARVLAKDVEDFLVLLAIGYDEVCFAAPPEHPPEDPARINPQFQAWVRQTLTRDIPITGQTIVATAMNEYDDLFEWLIANGCEGWQ